MPKFKVGDVISLKREVVKIIKIKEFNFCYAYLIEDLKGNSTEVISKYIDEVAELAPENYQILYGKI